MRKFFCILMVFCVIFLWACSGKAEGTTNAEPQLDIVQQPEVAVSIISTPFVDICVPKAFEGNVVHDIAAEDPYTVCFKTVDGTELFTLVFNGAGDILLGTLVSDGQNTVIRMNVPELDPEHENYEHDSLYQDGVNTVIRFLDENNDFHAGALLETANVELMDIETPLMTLKYPAKWRQIVQIDVLDNCVKFSNEGTPLFDLLFVECDGYLLGMYKDMPVYLIDYLAETDEQLTMQEDVNVILQNLMRDSNFVAAQS